MARLFNKFLTFYGNWNLTTAFTSTTHPDLFWTRSIPRPLPNRCCTSTLILYTHLRLALPSGLFPHLSPPKFCRHLSYTLRVPNAHHNSLLLNLSPELYFIRSTDHKAPRYTVFSIPMLPRPSYARYHTERPFSNVLSNKPHSTWQNHMKQRKIIVLHTIIFTYPGRKLERNFWYTYHAFFITYNSTNESTQVRTGQAQQKHQHTDIYGHQTNFISTSCTISIWIF